MEAYMVLRWVFDSVMKLKDSIGFSSSSLKKEEEYEYDDESSEKKQGKSSGGYFEMPVHYPRYKKVDYEKMEEWKLDILLREYGLHFNGTLDEKRSFAIGAFLWPNQL